MDGAGCGQKCETHLLSSLIIMLLDWEKWAMLFIVVMLIWIMENHDNEED